jgi:hypothetical protein
MDGLLSRYQPMMHPVQLQIFSKLLNGGYRGIVRLEA